MRLQPDLASAGDFTPEHELYADSPVPTPATEDGTQPAGSTSPKRRHDALADEEGWGEVHEDEAPGEHLLSFLTHTPQPLTRYFVPRF